MTTVPTHGIQRNDIHHFGRNHDVLYGNTIYARFYSSNLRLLHRLFRPFNAKLINVRIIFPGRPRHLTRQHARRLTTLYFRHEGRSTIRLNRTRQHARNNGPTTHNKTSTSLYHDLIRLYPTKRYVPYDDGSNTRHHRNDVRSVSNRRYARRNVPILHHYERNFRRQTSRLNTLISSTIRCYPCSANVLSVYFYALHLQSRRLHQYRVHFLLYGGTTRRDERKRVFLYANLNASGTRHVDTRVQRYVNVRPLYARVSNRQYHMFTRQQRPRQGVLFQRHQRVAKTSVSLLRRGILKRGFRQTIIRTIRRNFGTNSSARVKRILIRFSLRMKLVPRFLLRRVKRRNVQTTTIIHRMSDMRIQIIDGRLYSKRSVLPRQVVGVVMFVKSIRHVAKRITRHSSFVTTFRRRFQSTRIRSKIKGTMITNSRRRRFVIQSRNHRRDFTLFFRNNNVTTRHRNAARRDFNAGQFQTA